jgi:8-oxo-dGTP pyrophosphatase MutT (NUDIX family)
MGTLRTAREAAVFIRREDRFLILHRPHEDYWHIVAGVVEDGETIADAARRELLEETGLDAPVTDLATPQRYRVPAELRHEYEADVDEVTIGNFEVHVPRMWEPTLNDEHDDYRWLTLAEAIAILHWRETAELLAKLAERGRGAR